MSRLAGSLATIARWLGRVARAEGDTLSTQAVAVGVIIARAIGPRWHRATHVPASHIESQLGCSKGAAAAAVAELIDAGFLRRAVGDRNAYSITCPAPQRPKAAYAGVE